jgi:hypothetical protein
MVEEPVAFLRFRQEFELRAPLEVNSHCGTASAYFSRVSNTAHMNVRWIAMIAVGCERGNLECLDDSESRS